MSNRPSSIFELPEPRPLRMGGWYVELWATALSDNGDYSLVDWLAQTQALVKLIGIHVAVIFALTLGFVAGSWIA